ncbi:MAG: ribose 1,5-bisphosphate isomerase, partial [Pyrodictiaceae archaeon]
SVKGVVVNWAPVVEAGWHVDPLFLEAKAVVDATGHDAYLVRLLAKRFPHLGLSVPGMASLSAWKGEEMVVEKTGKILPGLYVAGMSVAETYNTPRMGPLASGMMVSGKKVAEIIARDLEEDVR